MRGIELEEGEAYYLQADHDDDVDQNIDPDRDFSYIDRKIEYFLGHYQKDFMGGVSPRSLGARYGGYGSFLPMHERTPPILSNEQTQSNGSLKSPRNLPSENLPPQHCYQNHGIAAKISLPASDVPIPDQGGRSLKEPSLTGAGLPSVTDQFKLRNSGEGASNLLEQPKKPVTCHSEPNMLKFRVKMASASVLSQDNSAIYSGLGLDLSPYSSSEGSPSENDGASPCLLEMKDESPSIILKNMTSIPLLNESLLSPLPGELICLIEVKNNLETALIGFRQAEPPNLIHERACLAGHKEACEESNEKLDAVKEKKPNQEHTTKERNVKQNVQMLKPVEFVKERDEFLAKSRDLSASKKQEVGIPVAKETVSSTFNSINANAREIDKSHNSRATVLFDKKNDAGCVVEDMDICRKQVRVAKQIGKSELGFASSDEAVEKEGIGNESKGKTDKDKSTVLPPLVEPFTDKRKELGLKYDKVNNVSKPPSVVKVKLNEEDSDSLYPKEAVVYVKDIGMPGKTPNDKETGSVSLKVVKDNGKHCGIPQEVQYLDSEKIGSPKSSHSKAVSHVQMGLSVKELSPSLLKKNLKDSHANDVTEEPPRGSLGVRSSHKDCEEVINGNKIVSRSKKVEIDSHRKLRKDSEADINENSSKKVKEVSSRNPEVGVSERETQQYASKVKEQHSSEKAGFPDMVPKVAGGLAGGNSSVDRFSVGQLPPTANAMPLEMDNWVGCEKCNKWRLLPFGVNPESLPKKWVCSMITWLPGMNKCSVSEDETTNALRAQYLPPAPAPALQVSSQQAHSHRSRFANGLPVPQNFGSPSNYVLPNRGKAKNLAKSEIDLSADRGAHDVHRLIKRDQPDSGGIRSSKNLKSFSEEPDWKNVDGRPSAVSNKRLAEFDVSGVPKKVKKEHQQPVKDSDLVGLLPVGTKAESQNPDASCFLQEFVHRSSEYSGVRVKDSGRPGITAKVNQINDVSEKKMKLRDQSDSAISAGEPFDNCQQPMNNLAAVKERKSNTSNLAALDRSADKGCHRTHGDYCKPNSGHASDGGKHSGVRINDISMEQCHGDRAAEKTPGARKTPEKIPDLGLSDNTTTSSSSKVTGKVKPKAREVKCSPVGSISSSPLKVCKADPGKGTKKIVVSRDEREETSSRKRLKSQVNNACVPHYFAPPNEDLKDRKSCLSKTFDVLPDATNGHNYPRASSGKKPSIDRVNIEPIPVGHKRSGSKLDHKYHEEETMASENKLENHALNGSHIDGTKSKREKLSVPEKESEEEISISAHCVPESGKGSMSNSVRADNESAKLSRQVKDGHANFRHPTQIGYAPKDVEASSSKKEDSLPLDAKNALREATSLKHSANRLKTAGSGQSTGLFFLAALKFLHGASLLEPGNNENGRMGETTSTEVYRSTAKLCEYCAHEFEKCNDMASAALAYKCMEFGYMRVTYYNDAAVSRDRAELQMAVRASSQVESPSSSASDIDNLNNHALAAARDGHSAVDNKNHVICAGSRPNFLRLLSFTHDINLAMKASRRSHSAFEAASPILLQAGNAEGISSIKRVLDFSFHDVGGLLHLVRLAMEALEN